MNKQELFNIATDSSKDLSERYQVARELQRRREAGDAVTTIVRFYPYLTPSEIAEELGIPYQTVEGIATRLGLRKVIGG